MVLNFIRVSIAEYHLVITVLAACHAVLQCASAAVNFKRGVIYKWL